MARKSKSFEIPDISEGEKVKIVGPAALKSFRELCGISQDQLAKESGVSRSIIANYESERTTGDGISIDNLLNIYRALNVREQATRSINGTSIREALMGLLWTQRLFVNKRLREIDGQIDILKKKRERELRLFADTENEEKQLRSAPAAKVR